MTAIPVPSVSRIDAEEDIVFDDNKLKKNLLPDFENFENLPADWAFNVFLRLRPFTDRELKAGEDQECLQIADNCQILTANAPKESKKFKASNRRGFNQSVKQFAFTKIFDGNTDQRSFYQATAQPVIKDFVSGKNGLVFTYGVTNSGKTYSLQGTPGNEGIIPQAVSDIFDDIGAQLISDVQFIPKIGGKLCYMSESEKVTSTDIKSQVLSMADRASVSGNQKTLLCDTLSDVSSQLDSCNTTAGADNSQLSTTEVSESPVKYAIFVSFVELYCELLHDLLVPVTEDKLKSGRRGQVLTMIDDKKGGSHITRMREIQVNSASEVMKVLSAGQKNLHVAATRLNKGSSRSHCIFTITLVKVKDIPKPKTAEITRMYFCDLAGSERPAKTGEAGKRLKEAGNINNSLMKLGMCFETLRHNQKHRHDKSRQKAFAYRDSKLTRLFRNCLLGEGRTCMIVNANMCASGFDETLHVLEFSGVARDVKRIEDTKRGTKRKTEITDDEFFAKVKSSRMTIDWVKTPPAEDNEDTVLENDDEESEYDSESDTEDEDIECDIGYWKLERQKHLNVIEYLKSEYKKLFDAKTAEQKKAEEKIKAIKIENSKREDEIREKAHRYQRKIMQEMKEERDEHVEGAIARMTDEQNSKQELMELMSGNNLRELKQRNEDRLAALKVEHEKDLKNLRAELNGSAESERTKLQLEITNLKLDNERQGKEIDALKRRSRRSSVCKDYDTKQLLLQIEDGKDLIKSLMEESDECRQQLEDMQDENNSLKIQLAQFQDDANTRQIKMEEKELEIVDLRNIVHELKCDIAGLEKKSEGIMKKSADFCGDIVVLDESKTLCYTEGILQCLVESLEKNAAEICALRDDIKGKDGAISDLKLSEMKLVEDLKISAEKVDHLCAEKVSIEKELEFKISDGVKTTEDLRILSDKLNEVQKIADEFHDLQEKEKNASLANCELQEEMDGLKKQLNDKVSESDRQKVVIEQSGNKIDDLEKQLEDKVNELEQLQNNENNGLKKELENTIKELELQGIENKQSEDKIAGLKKALSSNMKELEQQKIDNKESENKIDGLKKQLDSKIQELRQQEIENKQSGDKIDGLKTELDCKIKELGQQNIENRESVDKIDGLKKQFDDKIKELERQKSENKQFEDKIDGLEKQLESKVKELEQLKIGIERSEDKMNDLRKQLDSNMKEKEQQKIEMKQVVNEKDAISEKLQSLEAEFEAKKHVLRETRGDANGKGKENEVLRRNLEISDEKWKALQIRVDELTESKSVADETVASLRSELDVKNRELQAALNDSRAYDDELKRLRDQNTNTRSDLLDLESQVKRLQRSHQYDESEDLKCRLKNSEAARQKAEDRLKKVTEKNENSDRELDDVKNRYKKLTEHSEKCECELEDLKSKLRQKEQDHASLKANYDKFRSEVTDVQNERLRKLESANSRLVAEKKSLENDLLQSKKASNLREKELNQFRDSRDRIVEALEGQIAAERECRDKLEDELQEQASEKARLKSENRDLQTQLREKNAGAKSDVNSQVINETDVDSGRSKRSRKQSTDDEVTTAARPSRGAKRGSSILKRGKRKARPATPLPEVFSDVESPVNKAEILKYPVIKLEVLKSPVQKSEILKSPAKKSKISETSSQNNGNEGVLDDSELLKETGNRRCFPEPTIEIDATPDTSKRTRKRRQKTAKNSDVEDSAVKSSTRSMTRRKTRAANYNNSNSNDVDAGSPMLASNSKTLGSRIKNSPVGNAFKGLKDAVASSTSKSPKKTRKASASTRPKRRFKLQPEEISSPFDAMPDVVDCDDADFVSDTPSRIVKRLRQRK